MPPRNIGRGRGMRRFFKLFRDKRGATAVEYGLILALVFLAMAGAAATLAGTTTGMWNYVAAQIRGS